MTDISHWMLVYIEHIQLLPFLIHPQQRKRLLNSPALGCDLNIVTRFIAGLTLIQVSQLIAMALFT